MRSAERMGLTGGLASGFIPPCAYGTSPRLLKTEPIAFYPGTLRVCKVPERVRATGPQAGHGARGELARGSRARRGTGVAVGADCGQVGRGRHDRPGRREQTRGWLLAWPCSPARAAR